jgi:hypothetical protein
MQERLSADAALTQARRFRIMSAADGVPADRSPALMRVNDRPQTFGNAEIRLWRAT